MIKQNFDINKLRVASPCSVGWETMNGDEKKRFCGLCKLNVYNFSEMTKSEIEDLITKREGRVCIRLYKRADGTILTKDCPVGFRAYQKRVARFAGAALTAVLGLFSVSFGQKTEKNTIDASKIKIIKTVNQNEKSLLSGVLLDLNGAVVPGIEIKLYKKDDKKKLLKVNSDENGIYTFNSLLAGTYILEIKGGYGFKKYKIINIEIKDNEKNQIDVILEPNSVTVTVGIYTEEPLIDTTSSSVKTTIDQKMIEKLPH